MESTFHTLFSIDSDKSIHAKKNQILYLCNYLKEKQTKTIIIERDYIDRSYLEDYLSYYSRCFNQYGKKCKRLHFFKDYDPLPGLSQEEFEQWIIGDDCILDDSRLTENYIGFAVVKPLPETVIGRTCLEAPQTTSTNKQFFFPTTKNYEAGLCGLTLKIENSLPFQEQDKITSACATSALWTLFHSYSPNSGLVKSPSTITKIASNGFFAGIDQQTPGLTPEMMGAALSSEGLQPLLIKLKDDSDSNKTKVTQKARTYIYPYLKSGIPVLLGVDAYKYDEVDKAYKHKGKHAVTICGYSLKQNIKTSNHTTYDFILKSEFIDSLYVHDDQVGPFAELSVSLEKMYDNNFADPSKKRKIHREACLRYDPNKTNCPYIYSPSNIIIGLYHKIRISLPTIEDCSAKFSDFLSVLASKDDNIKTIIYPRGKPLIWDIFLTSPTAVKEEIHKNTQLSQSTKQHLLKTNLPRYIWKARANNDDGALFELLFDATDIPQGTIFIDLIELEIKFKSLIDVVCQRVENIPEKIRKDKYGTIYKVLKRIYSRTGDTKPHLSDIYGHLRPPLLFKPHEKNSLEEIIKHPDLTVIRKPGDECALSEDKYIWAISEEGDICIAPDNNSLGHPCLVGGGFARICGELTLDEDAYILNNASGRYSKHTPSNSGEFLNNAKTLFEERIPQIRIKQCVESSRHGELSITELTQFIETANAVPRKNAKKTFKILWEIGRRNPEIKKLFCKEPRNSGIETTLRNRAFTELTKHCQKSNCGDCTTPN